MAKRFSIRVAAGTVGGPQSSIWAIWSKKDDIYMAPRHLGGVEKVSFHANGISRRAFTKEYANGSRMSDRLIHGWSREDAPHPALQQAVPLAYLRFPAGHLSLRGQDDSKPIHWLGEPGAGRAIVVQVLLTHEPPQHAEQLLRSGDVLPLACHIVASGQTLVIATHDVDWQDRDVIMPASQHEQQDYLFTSRQLPGLSREMRITRYSSPEAHQPIVCTELSGYRLNAGRAVLISPQADLLPRDRTLARKVGGNA